MEKQTEAKICLETALTSLRCGLRSQGTGACSFQAGHALEGDHKGGRQEGYSPGSCGTKWRENPYTDIS